MHSRQLTRPVSSGPLSSARERPLPIDPKDLTIREYRPGDEVAILATFNRVFQEIDPGFEPRSLAEWRWQYLANPSGWRIWLAVDPEGGVASQYAGVGQRMRLAGGEGSFCQAVDSMTDPAYRRGLKRPGFFVLTAYPFAKKHGGPPPDHDTIVWGLPVPSAWRIGKTYLSYELVRTQLELAAPLEALELAGSHGCEVDELSSWPEEVGAFTAQALEPFGASAVRDAAQLDWRFVKNPRHDYVLARARRGSRWCGLCVYRKGAFDGKEDRGLLCDWVVSPGDDGARHALLAWARERAARDGAGELTLVLPDRAPDWLALQAAGFRAAPTRYFLTGRTFDRRYDMRWLRANWYYTLGDTDLV